MGKTDEIRHSLRELMRRTRPDITMLAKVISVNESALTCDLKDDDQDELVYKNVRLRPVIDGQESVTLIPKANTWALAIKIEDSEQWMVIACGEVEKFKWKVGDASLEQTASGLKIKKGTETLREALIDLIEGLEPIIILKGRNPNKAKIQSAKTKIQNILQ